MQFRMEAGDRPRPEFRATHRDPTAFALATWPRTMVARMAASRSVMPGVSVRVARVASPQGIGTPWEESANAAM
jgi:hypothetical protein